MVCRRLFLQRLAAASLAADASNSLLAGAGLGVQLDPDKLACAAEVYRKCGMRPALQPADERCGGAASARRGAGDAGMGKDSGRGDADVHGVGDNGDVWKPGPYESHDPISEAASIQVPGV
jgi:hypothetical protein